jgi:hypothetical protein
MPTGADLDWRTARLLSIGLAFLAGALAGGVVVTAVPGFAGGPIDAGPDPRNPPFSTASAGPNCVDDEPIPNAGWVHRAPVSDADVVTLNATVVHDAGTEVRGSVLPQGDNGYELALRTVSVTPERSLGCDRVRTRIEMVVSLPAERHPVVVTMNGREQVRVPRESSFGGLYRLPNPLDATAQAVTSESSRMNEPDRAVHARSPGVGTVRELRRVPAGETTDRRTTEP